MKLLSPRFAQFPAPVRLILFLLLLLLIWLPFALPLYLLGGANNNGVSILITVILYSEFIYLIQAWGRQVYQDKQTLWRYGLRLNRGFFQSLVQGLAIGVISLLVMFSLSGLLGWITWQAPQPGFVRLLLEGLLMAVGVGFAEELLFRGWLLDELERDYQALGGLWGSSALFAILHFIKPLPEVLQTLPQFAGLLLLGLLLVWARRRPQPDRGSLGLPIGLHAGLIWGYYLLNVGKLTRYTGQVPDWVTGVNGNPLAGLLGLLFLGAIAVYVRRSPAKG